MPSTGKGYIGVTHVHYIKRFEQHRTSNSLVGRMIRRYFLTADDVRPLHYPLEAAEARELERRYRPHPMMGWNERPGGAGIKDGKIYWLYYIPHRGRRWRIAQLTVLVIVVLCAIFVIF